MARLAQGEARGADLAEPFGPARATAMNSRLVIADAAESRLRVWLSASTFAGLAAYAAFGRVGLDPVAGYVIAAYAIWEGKEA